MKSLLTCLFFAFSLASYGQLVPKQRALIGNDSLLTRTNSTVEQLSIKRKKTVLEIIGKVGSNPLIIIDGAIFKGLSDTIDTDKIEQLQVLKGEDAQNIYGKQAKDGAVLISMKHPADNTVEAKPLIIINDTVRDIATMYQLNPNEVAWVDVIKNAREIATYGPAGANGVVKIYLKDYVKRSNRERLSKLSEGYNQYTRIHPGKDVVCMINGTVIKDGNELFKLSVNDIEQADFKISETSPSINIITKH
jgi:hypothetical protein